MSDSEDEENCWYSDSDLEGDDAKCHEECNSNYPDPEIWIQQEQTEGGRMKPSAQDALNEFARFASWRAGMPSSCSVPPSALLHSHNRPPYDELRQRKLLCLHYFSNMLGFSFDDENEDVYPLESIKEWNDIREFAARGDMLVEHIQQGGNRCL